MNKKNAVVVFLLLCFCIFVTDIVYAVTEKVILDIPGSKIVNGKNISVVGIERTSLNIDVDGVTLNVEDNKSKLINGAEVYVEGFSRSPPRAILEITVKIHCGDGTCATGEDSVICCKDCGCLKSNFACISNRCVENVTDSRSENECLTNKDCSDENTCTTEVCDTSNYPNKCVFTEITLCEGGDRCCPRACDTAEDKDCAAVDKCESKEDCDDSNACSTDTCGGKPKRCSNKVSKGCNVNGECVEANTIYAGEYCIASSGIMTSQRSDTSECEEDYECLSLICSWGKCGSERSTFLPKLFGAIIGILALLVIVYVVIVIKKNVTE